MNITVFLTNNNIGVINLTPTITINDISNGAKIIDAVNMTEISSVNCAGWYKYDFLTYDENIEYIFTADAGTDNIDDRFPTGSNPEMNTETNIHNSLDNYANKNDYKSDSTLAKQTEIIEDIALINVDFETNIHNSLDNYTNKNDYKADSTLAKQTEIIEDISLINVDFETNIHNSLDNYTNKNDYKADSTLAKQTEIIEDISLINVDFETNIHNSLDNYSNKNDYKSDSTLAKQTEIIEDIALMNVDLVDISGNIEAIPNDIWSYTRV